MDKIYTFLEQHKEIAFATVGSDGKPKIRVFQIMKIDEVNKALYFATAPNKEVCKQLKNNPAIELLSMAGNVSIRIGGDAIFNVSDTICREIYNTNAILQRLYEDYQKLVYFRLSIHSLDYFDLNTNPPTLNSYRL